MACRDGWAAQHPEQISRFMKSIGRAEEFIINHPAEAKAILQKRLNYIYTKGLEVVKPESVNIR
jgi:ABC-type nitrate/sulfonate/bicarbonate transport system substrate-binding protein